MTLKNVCLCCRVPDIENGKIQGTATKITNNNNNENTETFMGKTLKMVSGLKCKTNFLWNSKNWQLYKTVTVKIMKVVCTAPKIKFTSMPDGKKKILLQKIFVYVLFHSHFILPPF